MSSTCCRWAVRAVAPINYTDRAIGQFQVRGCGLHLAAQLCVEGGGSLIHLSIHSFIHLSIYYFIQLSIVFSYPFIIVFTCTFDFSFLHVLLYSVFHLLFYSFLHFFSFVHVCPPKNHDGLCLSGTVPSSTTNTNHCHHTPSTSHQPPLRQPQPPTTNNQSPTTRAAWPRAYDHTPSAGATSCLRPLNQTSLCLTRPHHTGCMTKTA